MIKGGFRYWICQVVGWGVLGLIGIYFNFFVFGEQFAQNGGKKEYLISLGIFLLMGILTTHLLRIALKQTNWLKFSFDKIALLFILGVGSTGIVMYYASNTIEHNTPYSHDNYIYNKKLERAKKAEADAGLDRIPYYKTTGNTSAIPNSKVIEDIRKTTGWFRNKNGEWQHEDKTELLGIFQNLMLIALWLLIYIVYHYVLKNRNDQLDRLKLESTVKELELKTIKSHINPHFIFNSLNSIRALVDENPERARRAITELSNILRSSMQAEKQETVTLEKEMGIVSDYLALEHMRFEERLKVEMNIDEDTLGQPIPPMMLQTLVENAIKHGISKRIDGGFIKISSFFEKDHHELIVQNTGQLNGKINADGFGIQSTEDRLNLLFHGKASFEIKNLNPTTVQSKVIIPVHI